MGEPCIDDCLALLDRADVHIGALDKLFQGFLDGPAYRIETHIDLDTLPSVDGESTANKEIVLIGHVNKVPPTREAGVLIFDAINSLRASLDHMAWLLSIRNTAPPVGRLPRGDPWRTVSWPVVWREADWPSACGSHLRFIKDIAVLNVIKERQPFYRRQDEPERDEFAVLDELWRVHKHRHIPLTEFWVGLDKVVSRHSQTRVFDAPPGYGDGLRQWLAGHGFEVVSQHPAGPFEDGAELGRVRETGPLYSVYPEFDMHAYIAIEIAFDKGSPAYGGPVKGTLSRIREEVGGAITALAPFAR